MHVEQTSNQVSERRWEWAIWLVGSDDELDEVEKVVYHLHPTFSQPVVEVSDRDTSFRFETSGWGTFVIKVQVIKKDGDEVMMRHRLRFARTEPTVFVSATAAEEKEVEEVKEIMKGLHIGVSTSLDVAWDEDPLSEARQRIDLAKAVILINGTEPSRWVFEEIEAAKALGKPIVSIGPNNFYKASKAMEIGSPVELGDVISKLPE